jgi:hypothetical protein
MALNPATVTRLVQLAQAAANAPLGQKQPLYTAAAAELGVSAATLHRYLGQVTVKPTRKQRSDAGVVELIRDDAKTISALLMTSARKTGKRLMSIGQAVDILLANGEIKPFVLDAETGELIRLSDSAIARALRSYGMHPDQLNRPTPAVALKSLHPNHVWQIDASICVLYYLNASSPKEAGLQVMEHDQFYKNKPANLKRIEADRVWSYEVTDHNSGAIFVNYVLGAESGANLAESFIAAIQKRPGDPLHGVPFILMMDMGSANTSGLFGNLARRLQVQLIAHSPGNARATGQVEKARDLIERSFESSLRLQPVRDLADLNACAQRWACWFNANKVHTRHGKTRFEQWLTIAPEQLRIAPPAQVCFELLSEKVETRKVNDDQTVSFKGQLYCVKSVPGVMIGEKLSITVNPYVRDAAQVLLKDADGHEVLHSIPLLTRDDAGFLAHANVIGEDYCTPKDTQLDTNRKEVARFAYDATTDEEALARRKAGVVPLGGRIDPYKVIEQAPQRTFMPKQGAAMVPTVTTTSTPKVVTLLSLYQVNRWLADQGVVMDGDKNAQMFSLCAKYGDAGVPETELPDIKARMTVRSSLRVVNGGVV